MEAGRGLDALVAAHVMGGFVADPDALAPVGEVWFWIHPKDGVLCGSPWLLSADGEKPEKWDHSWAKWMPSTDIAAAWRVVGEMERRGYWAEMRTPFGFPFSPENDGYWCGYTPHGITGWNGTPDHHTSAATLPLAICLAALKAVRVDVQGGGNVSS